MSIRTTSSRRVSPRVTINDVSSALGLTKGTVSRALNGYADISESTRQRVQRAALKMGYAPLAHAQAMRTGRVRALGLVLQVGQHDAQRPFLADFLAGVSGAVSDANWSLTVATAASEGEGVDTLKRLIEERKADGFILPRPKLSDPRIAFLRQAGIPFVMYGRTADTEDCAWFDILGEAAMAEAVERFHAQGHRRIGYLGGGAEYAYSPLREAGFTGAMAACGLPTPAELICQNAVTVGAGAQAAAQLLAQKAPPTAIVCATDAGALGVYEVAQRLGLRIGQDLSVISYDGIPDGAYVDPPLSTYEVDSRAAGAQLATLLIRRIYGEPVENLRETAKARLHARGSDGPPAKTSDALHAWIAQHGLPAPSATNDLPAPPAGQH